MNQVCNHVLVPLVYGYMTYEITKQIENKEIIYGGYHKPPDAANYFCFKCLEDINL